MNRFSGAADCEAAPLPLHQREELSALLRDPFPAESGCFREGTTCGIYVSSEPGSAPGLVNLQVQLFSRSAPAPATSLERETTSMTLKVYLALLHHRRPEMRVGACQTLGRLGCMEVRERLQEIARTDPDEEVREAAAAALDDLAIPALPPGAVANVEFVLRCTTPSGPITLVGTNTDELGCTRFIDVPETSCGLELAESERVLLNANPFSPAGSQLPSPVAFNHIAVAKSCVGDFALEISPQADVAGLCFDAVLRVSVLRPGPDRPLRLPFRPVARRDRHVYQPSFESATEPLVTFGCLPMGEYELLWHDSSAPGVSSPRLSAKSTIVAKERRLALDACLQLVVHPADRRLVATVEPDRGGRVVLTVAADAQELPSATVRYDLAGERGELRICAVEGTGVSRGVRYLSQRFAPESALSLNLEIAS